MGVAGPHERHGAPGPAAAALTQHRGDEAARSLGLRRRHDVCRLVGPELAVPIVRRVGGTAAHRRRAGAHAAKDGELHGFLLVGTWGRRISGPPIVVSEVPVAGVPVPSEPVCRPVGWARPAQSRSSGAEQALHHGVEKARATASASPVVRSTRSPTRGQATGTLGLGGCPEEPADRLGPPVHRQVERGPVERHEERLARRGLHGARRRRALALLVRAAGSVDALVALDEAVGDPSRVAGERFGVAADAVDVAVRRQGLLGIHVDVGPEGVVGADGHEREVEGAEVGADGGEPLGRARVAGVVGRVHGAVQGPAGPERLAVDEAATGVVPGLGAGHPDAGDLGLTPPVERGDACLRHTPGQQVGVDAERHDVVRLVRLLELHDRRVVEVVVVVVADQHRVDRRDLGDGTGHGVHPPRARVTDGGDPLAEDRIDEEAGAVELEHRRRMAVPRDGEVARRLRGAGRHDRHRSDGLAATAHPDRRDGSAGLGSHPRAERGLLALEASPGEVRGALDEGQDRGRRRTDPVRHPEELPGAGAGGDRLDGAGDGAHGGTVGGSEAAHRHPFESGEGWVSCGWSWCRRWAGAGRGLLQNVPACMRAAIGRGGRDGIPARLAVRARHVMSSWC